MDETRLGETLGGDDATAGAARRQAGAKLRRGAAVGRYVILDPLGAGTMGMVYAAFDPDLDRRIAIKLLRPEPGRRASTTSARRARLLREAQALARLQHPNVVTVHDVGEHDDQIYVAMELVDGVTLKQWLGASPPRDEVMRVMLAAGRGLAAAHDKGLVHRDFKPDNVMLERDASGAVTRVVVLDFGLAASLEEAGASSCGGSSLHSGDLAVDLTRTGAVMGTPAYMSPEQHAGGSADAASDQFSFCVALYEALYGTRPFEGENLALLAARVMAGVVDPPPSDRRVPTWLRRVVMRGLSRKPADRFPSVSALLVALEDDPSRRRRRFFAVATAVGVVGVAFAGSRWREHEREAQCRAEASTIDEVYDAAARDDIEAAMLATGLPYAAAAWQRLRPQLDARVAEWRTTRLETCLARPTLGPDQRAGQDGCLDDDRERLSLWIDILREADATVVNQAPWVLRRRGTDECRDLERLRRREIVGDDPDQRTRVRELSRRLMRVNLLGDAGRFDEQLVLADSCLEQARELDTPSLVLAARLERGDALARLERYEEAAEVLEEAFFAARRLGDEPRAARAALQLTAITGSSLSQFDVGRRWARHADASLPVDDRDPLVQAELQQQRAAVEQAAGNYASAREFGETALRTYERSLEADSIELLAPLTSLGVTYMRLAEHERARALFRRVLDISIRRLGPDHPRVAEAKNSLGNAYARLGAPEQAEVLFREASTTQRELGLLRPQLRSLSNLSMSLRLQDKTQEALEILDHSVAIARRTHIQGDRELGIAIVNHGQALEAAGRLDDAIGDYEEALAQFEDNLGPDHVETADAVYVLAVAAYRHGDARRAFDLAVRMLRTLGPALAPDHPKIMSALQLLAGTGFTLDECETVVDSVAPFLPSLQTSTRATNERQIVFMGYAGCARRVKGAAYALPYARRAVELAEEAGVPDNNGAAARFELGRTLWESGAREEGGAMAQQAFATLAEVAARTPNAVDGLDQMRQWLADNPGVLPQSAL